MIRTFSLCMLVLLPAAAQSQNTDVFEAAQRAADAAERAAGIIPPGSVMTFNLESCPVGWMPFAAASGRVIVGVGFGNRDVNDRKLTDRSLGDFGGAETNTLTVDQMPAHSHVFTGMTIDRGGIGGDYVNEKLIKKPLSKGTAANLGPFTFTGAIAEKGGGKEFNTMPPFLNLLYCERL
ncbi:MAG: hypothetical protein ACU0DI_07460 [Paracoccaceae bacterium]